MARLQVKSILVSFALIAAAFLAGCAIEPDLYKCINNEIRISASGVPPEWSEGYGPVYIEVDENPSGRATVNYDDRHLIFGELELDNALYITDRDWEVESRYPLTVKRLHIDRKDGSGYFQSSTYPDGNTLPTAITESLHSCAPTERAF